LYWLENLVIGAFNVLKMALACGGMSEWAAAEMRRRGVTEQALDQWSRTHGDKLAAGSLVAHGAKLFLIPFFCVHYGIFMLVHGAFIVILLRGMGPGGPEWNDAVSDAFSPGILLALAMLVAEHAYEFYTGYVKNGLYRRTFAPVQMFAPYGRIVVMHLAIMAGGFLLVFLNAPRLMVLILVVLKTVFELGRHKRQVRRDQEENEGAVIRG
jgi:hypothetical protein